MKKQIDRFVLVQALSEGGAGSVYRADELLPGDVKRPVALKVLPVIPPNDQPARERFFGEVKLLATLTSHPNVVTIYAIGMADNVPWIAMEYLPGTLAQRIGEQPLPAGEVARLIDQVARGLSAMHSLTPPLLHNDLKPANILVDAYNNYKIADFTLASQIAVERTRPIATVRYSAPELLSREFGRPCPATDLYALGHIAYEMALGGKAYRQQFPQVFDPRQTNNEAPVPRWMAWHTSFGTKLPAINEVRADFPEALGRLIARLVAKPLADRYTAASEVLADLRQQSPGGSSPLPLSSGATPPAPSRGGVGFSIATTPSTSPSASAPPPPPPPAPGRGFRAGAAAAAAPSPAGAGQGNSEMYYVKFRGRIAGPYDFAALHRAVKQGLVSRLHQISTDRVTWRGIDAVEGLA